MKSVKVEIKKRESKKGRAYLYLEYYPPLFNPVRQKEIAKESLKRYVILRPRNDEDREFNADALRYARRIRNRRVKQINSKELGIFDDFANDMDFLEYYRERINKRNSAWQHSYKHFFRFVKGKCCFRDITYRMGEEYRAYLTDVATVKGIAKRRDKAHLHQNTASKYFQCFKSIAHDAFIEGYLKDNLSLYWKRVTLKKSQREFLTPDEVRRLFSTPCEYDVLVKTAAISVFSGLRLSDIITLDWEHIMMDEEGNPFIRKVIQKTGNLETIFINREALKYLGPKRASGLVFKEFRRSMLIKPLRDWVKAAGIEKNITFYSFRHTCATMLITSGADINTVSRHMTHSSILTTQQYFHLVNSKAREAADLISLE